MLRSGPSRRARFSPRRRRTTFMRQAITAFSRHPTVARTGSSTTPIPDPVRGAPPSDRPAFNASAGAMMASRTSRPRVPPARASHHPRRATDGRGRAMTVPARVVQTCPTRNDRTDAREKNTALVEGSGFARCGQYRCCGAGAARRAVHAASRTRPRLSVRAHDQAALRRAPLFGESGRLQLAARQCRAARVRRLSRSRIHRSGAGPPILPGRQQERRRPADPLLDVGRPDPLEAVRHISARFVEHFWPAERAAADRRPETLL